MRHLWLLLLLAAPALALQPILTGHIGGHPDALKTFQPPVAVDIDEDGNDAALIWNSEGEVWLLDNLELRLWHNSTEPLIGLAAFGNDVLLATPKALHLFDKWKNEYLEWPKAGSFTGPPLTADLQNDGYPEAFAPTSDGIDIYQITGRKRTLPVPSARIAAGDINGDGKLEIAATAEGKIYLFDSELTSVKGWPKTIGGKLSRPTISASEIAVTTSGGDYYLWDASGKEIFSYSSGQQTLSEEIPSPLFVNGLVVFAGPGNEVYAFKDGKEIWTVRLENATSLRFSPIAIDIVGDSSPELLVSAGFQLQVLKLDGSIAATYQMDGLVKTPAVLDAGSSAPKVVVVSESEPAIAGEPLLVLGAEESAETAAFRELVPLLDENETSLPPVNLSQVPPKTTLQQMLVSLQEQANALPESGFEDASLSLLSVQYQLDELEEGDEQQKLYIYQQLLAFETETSLRPEPKTPPSDWETLRRLAGGDCGDNSACMAIEVTWMQVPVADFVLDLRDVIIYGAKAIFGLGRWVGSKIAPDFIEPVSLSQVGVDTTIAFLSGAGAATSAFAPVLLIVIPGIGPDDLLLFAADKSLAAGKLAAKYGDEVLAAVKTADKAGDLPLARKLLLHADDVADLRRGKLLTKEAEERALSFVAKGIKRKDAKAIFRFGARVEHMGFRSVEFEDLLTDPQRAKTFTLFIPKFEQNLRRQLKELGIGAEELAEDNLKFVWKPGKAFGESEVLGEGLLADDTINIAEFVGNENRVTQYTGLHELFHTRNGRTLLAQTGVTYRYKKIFVPKVIPQASKKQQIIIDNYDAFVGDFIEIQNDVSIKNLADSRRARLLKFKAALGTKLRDYVDNLAIVDATLPATSTQPGSMTRALVAQRLAAHTQLARIEVLAKKYGADLSTLGVKDGDMARYVADHGGDSGVYNTIVEVFQTQGEKALTKEPFAAVFDRLYEAYEKLGGQ